jgi:putative ABC transport system permease protein
MDNLLKNVRLGVRLLARQPGFTAIAVLVLALGIGANSAMFSIVNTLLFRPIAVRDAEALVGVYSRNVAKPDRFRAFSYAEYAELRSRNDVFSGAFAHNLGVVGVLEGDTTRRAFFDEVSANYFDVMGVPLFRGRAFTAAEERPGAGIPVAIVSHAFWEKRGADPAFVGKALRLNGKLFTVVGIAPPRFTGTTAMVSPELYLPLGVHEAVANDFDSARLPLADARNHILIVVGRLRPGLSSEAVDARLAATAAGMQAGPADERQTFIARPLSRLSISTAPQSDDGLRVPALLLLFLSGVVLLIASLNVANMMLARGAARRREIAIRLALGARRGNVLAQLCTEGVLLAVLGGAAGLVLAAWGTRLLVRSLGALAPFDLVVSSVPDVRVLAATAAFCLLSTVLFALGPAWNVSRAAVAGDLKTGQRELPSGKRGGRLARGVLARRNLLVLAQLALSLMLLSTAGLFVRSSLRTARLDPGFTLDRAVVVEVDPGLGGYDQAEGKRLVDALVERFRARPDVESASVAATVPFGMISLGRRAQRASDPPAAAGGDGKDAGLACQYNVVGEGYFATMGIRLLAGRAFTANEEGDETATVAILDRLAAERLWPGGGALGQTVRLTENSDSREATLAQVVGVVDNVQEQLLGEALSPHVYVPFGPMYQSDMNVHLRLVGGTAAEARFLAAARGEVRAVAERLPVLTVRSLRRHVDESFDVWVMRTAARLFTVFGVVAMLLAAVGLYGVRAFAVARRTREIGIRMAVGASAGDAVRMVLREGMLLTAVGGAAGLLLSLALGRLMAGMLYRVSGADPVVLGAAAGLLAGASLLACYVPARRAARVAPMVSLRNE